MNKPFRSGLEIPRVAAGRTTGGPRGGASFYFSFATDRTTGDAGFRRSR